VRETVVVVKRRDFPPLLCAIVSCVIPWRRFVSPFRFAVYRFEPKSKKVHVRLLPRDPDRASLIARNICGSKWVGVWG